MLRFFRVNDPYRLFAILVVLFLCSLPLFLNPPPLTKQELRNILVGESITDGKLMYVHLYDSTAPFSAVVFALLDWILGRSLVGREILALLILFFQAAFFSILLINNRAYNDNTYVPGLIYGLLCFVSFDFLAVSPELLASTVLLLALNNLFREIEFRIQRDETILSVGLLVGFASLFIFSYSLFLIAAFTILGTFTRISFRKAILLIFGFLLPHGLVFMLYFSLGETALLWRNFYQTGFSLGSENLISARSLLFLGALPLTYFVFSLFMLTREARFTKYQSQLFQVMFLWMIFSLGEIFLTKEMTPHSFIPIIPSLTYFFSHYLLLIRRKWIAETVLWMLLAGVLTINHLALKGKIASINYSDMFLSSSPRDPQVRGKKVMVLGEDLPLYRDNQLGGYFLEWSLSEEVATNMDQYANVLKMYELFEKFPPDIIIDEKNLFPAIVERIPSLKKAYQKEERYYRRISR